MLNYSMNIVILNLLTSVLGHILSINPLVVNNVPLIEVSPIRILIGLRLTIVCLTDQTYDHSFVSLIHLLSIKTNLNSITSYSFKISNCKLIVVQTRLHSHSHPTCYF